MNAELIDSLYENEAIESVAVFDATSGLIENHLALNEETVSQIGSSVLEIKSGLQQAGREMQGFVVRTPKYTFLLCFHGTATILLQISPGHSLEKTHRAVVSQLGSTIAQPSGPRPGTVQQLGTPSPVKQSTASPAAAQPASQPASTDGNAVDYSEFEHGLLKILKPIATSVIAGKMITKAAKKLGIAPTAGTQLPADQAITLGREVISQIPNAKKRQIVQNEYETFAAQYQ